MRQSPRLSIILLSTLFSLTSHAGGGTPAPTTPTESASKVKYTFTADKNPENIIPVKLLESVEIWPASDESNITHYNVYWGDALKNKLGLALAPRLAKIPATKNGKTLIHEFPDTFKMEVGAAYILVCTENQGKEFCGKENNFQKVADDFLGLSGTLQSLKSAISKEDEESCPGIEVMKTCGDLICNGIENATSCPSDCTDYKVSSFNYQTLCPSVKNVFHPTSVAEIKALVKSAVANNDRIKVTGGAGPNKTTGSASDIVCTDGIIIAMDQFNEKADGLNIKLEKFEGLDVVNTPAGTNLHDLGEWLYARDKSVGFTHLGWRHPSIAGNIGTSAHGSSPKHSNVLAQRVVSLDIVKPDGEFQTYSRGTTGVSNPDLWKSMTTHLGYFGVITGVRLEVEEAQNIQVKITYHDEKELFEENTRGGVFEDIQDCDYGQYNWFPSIDKYMRTCGKITQEAAEAGANNRLINPYINHSQFSVEQTMQTLQLGTCKTDSNAHKGMETLRFDSWKLTPPLVKKIDGVERFSSDVIGPVHRMTSSKLISLSKEVFQMDWEVAVPHKNLQAAMDYIKDFTNGDNQKNRNIAAPLIGIFVRFSKTESNTLMAYTGAGEEFEDGSISAHIEFPVFVPVNLNEEQFDNFMGPYEEMVSTLITRFGARAHWGKNMHSGDPWVFALQNQISSYGDRQARFSQKVGEFDPKGIFANPQAKMIGIQYPDFTYPSHW